MCGQPIRWSCNEKTGVAYCAHSNKATRMWKVGEFDKLVVCPWEAKCERQEDGSVVFVREIE
jgi:uncharacterized protein YaeQ